jgi:NodT family efflux transporter outer membrane factor (OMF) lipoprotein
MTSAGSLGLDEPASAPVAARWWNDWGDPQLTELTGRALQGHPSLALARARVERAAALAEVRRSAGTAQVMLGADLALQRYSEHGLTPTPVAGDVRTTGTVRSTLAWSPDLYGQQAIDLAVAIGQARAAQADAALAANALAAQVARSYVGLARLLAQRESVVRLLDLREQAVVLLRSRVAAGLDGQIDLAQAEGGPPEARGQIEALDGQMALARRQLSVLSGQAPAALDTLSPDLSQLRLDAMPPGLGADLLGRRPEVVAARWRVESALQDVALARTQFYPNVNLGAFVGLNALGLGRLLRAGSLEYGLAPALRLPLFDGDRLRHQLGVRQADLDAAIAAYNAAVLDAVREAGDALQSELYLQRQQSEQAALLASSGRALELARQRFAAGLGNQLAVLQAEIPVLAHRRQAADLRARQFDNRALLLKALGGGWHGDTGTPPVATR